jgi:HSP20 family protein
MRNLPVTPFLGLDRDFGRILDRFFVAPPRVRSTAAEGWPVRIDVSETEDAFVVNAELPGVDPAKLELSVQGDVLILSGEKLSEETKQEGHATYTERAYGAFRREIPLSSEVDADQAEAEHEHGVVTIRLPKAASVLPRRIEVKGP